MAQTQITSYDPDAIKSFLIEYMQSRPDFADFNYEGSAINTLIDLLVRNTHLMAFTANMMANESFLSTAQIRNNVVSHAQKLSYVPKSRTASTMDVSLLVTPFAATTKNTITMEKGTTFIATVDNTAYSFVATENAVLIKNPQGKFAVNNVILKQGQLITNKFTYRGEPISISNTNIDTSTLKMYVIENYYEIEAPQERFEYVLSDDITQNGSSDRVFFLTENTSGYYQFEFGKNILGREPAQSLIQIEYVAVQPTHANGLGTVTAASTIAGYSNIAVTVNTPAYGGSEKDDIERIRFIAPRTYKAQNRAVVESDFVAHVMQDFPFISSVTVWGGEKNDPPFYGRTFMSLIPVQDYNIVDSVKRAIEQRIEKYTIQTIPVVVDAKYVKLNLVIEYIFNDTKTSDTTQVVESNIASTIDTYNDSELKQFKFWYNNSELSEELRQIAGVESIQIRKKAFINLNVQKTRNFKYEDSFDNEINPGSLSLTGYVADIASTVDNIADDGLGNIVRTYTKNGITTSLNIGTVNYTTGKFSFIMQFLSTTPDELNVYVTPTEDDFFTERNMVVEINDISVNRVTKNRV